MEPTVDWCLRGEHEGELVNATIVMGGGDYSLGDRVLGVGAEEKSCKRDRTCMGRGWSKTVDKSTSIIVPKA